MASMSKMRDPNTPRHAASELPPRRPFQTRLPAFSRCPHSNTARNLVVCIDGTANQFSAKSTNIIELFSRLVKDEEGQLAFYNSGIGTYAKPSFRSFDYMKQVVYHTIDMAIAWNFEYIIHAAYEWLSENYKPGDRIYLFGFSRGAYQVRVIAGMIHKVGLLHKGNKNQIPFAYELYASVTDRTKREPEAKQATSSDSGSAPSTNAQTHLPDEVYPHLLDADIEDEHKLCKQFKATLCRKDVKVHFVGAWDTVSSIGIFRGKSLPETVSGMGHVCAFRHALALDERRVKFQPEYANGGLGPEQGDRGDVKEVWFAGSHSDIGGGNVTNENLSNFGPALRWMTYEAMTRGLRMTPYEGKWSTVVPKESLKGFWHLFELFPFPCLSYQGRDSLTSSPHLGAPRLIKPRQLIHESVFTALNAAQPTGIASKPGNKDSEAKSAADEVSSIVTSLKPTSAPSVASSLDLDDLSLLMPGAFSALVKIVSAPAPSPSRPYTPSAILPKVAKGRNYHWDELFSNFKTEPIVEKDPFDDMTHTLQTLEEFCAELEQRTRNNTLEDEELPAIRFHVFTATVLTLRSFVTDATRLASLAEVPNSSKILLDALSVAYEHLPSDRDSRRTLLRLLTHARSIPLRGERKYKTTQIKDWARTFGNEFPATLQTSFGNPLLQSQSTRGLVVDMCFPANTKSPYGVTLTISDAEENKTYVYFWDASSERRPNEVMSFPGLHARVSPDGSLVAVFSQDVVRVLNVKLDPDELEATSITETTDNSEQGQADDQASLWFSDDNALLANCDQRQIDLWHRVGSGDEWEASDASDTFEVTNPVKSCLTFLADNTKLAFINAESSISVLNLMSEDKEPFLLERSSEASVLTKSPSGEWLVSGHPHVVKVWSVESMTLFHNFLCDPNISSLAFRPDGQVLATGGDETIKLWNSNTWQWFQAFNGGGMITALAFSPDGSRLASASDVNGVSTVRLWDAEADVESMDRDDFVFVPTTSDVLADLGITPRNSDGLYDT